METIIMKMEQVKCCLNMRCKNRATCIHGIKYENLPVFLAQHVLNALNG